MKKALAQMVGRRIKEIRTSRNLTQQYMARLLEMQLPLYSRYERGELIFPLTYTLQVAMRFNIDPNYILGVTDIPAPYPQNLDDMGFEAMFIPQEPYTALTLRRFPTELYKKIKSASRERHVSILLFIIQCCEFALESIEGETQ